MADNSNIEWTDATWTIVTGCTKVSPGCKHCYAERDWARLSSNPAVRKYFGRDFGDVRLHPASLDQPIRWRRPRRVFVPSMGDLFHEGIGDHKIAAVFAVMAACPQHQFQVLTKRAARMRAFMAGRAMPECIAALATVAPDLTARITPPPDWPPRNVSLGVSAEDQAMADARISELLRTLAAVRFVSLEPLLAGVDLGNYLVPPGAPERIVVPHSLPVEYMPVVGLDWVIAGGESGPKARPTHPDAFRLLRDQCARARVPFLLKQWGAWAPVEVVGPVREGEISAGRAVAIGQGERVVWMRRLGKKTAGRTLDGRIHDEIPPSSAAASAITPDEAAGPHHHNRRAGTDGGNRP
jgi:protein gp37